MKKIIALSVTVLVAFAGPVAVSAESKIYTLEQCRDMALENNAKVKIAKGNVEAADQVSKEAFTKYFPTVSAQGMGFWSNRHIIDYDVLNLFTLEMIKNGIGAGVTAVQPVFAGGQIINGNRPADVGKEVAALEKEASVNEVVLTVEQYYWQIVTLKEKRRTLESVIALVDTLDRQVGVAVDAGVATRNDLLKVQLRRNELRSTMVDLDNGIKLSLSVLAQYIGVEGEPIDIVLPEMPDGLLPYPADLFVEPTSALAATVNYKLLDKQVAAAHIREKIEVGKNMPTVGVGAGYYYDRLINRNNHFGAVFVNVNIPISGWWGGSHAVKQRRIEARNAETRKTDLGQMLEIKMQSAWDDLTAAYRKMSIAKESIGQSIENLRLNENYYDAGTTTITDLLDAQTLYRQSCDSYTEAYGDFCMKRAMYLDATGRTSQLMEHDGLSGPDQEGI